MTRQSVRGRRRYCDCGRLARYKQRVLLYRPDLVTEVHFYLYLCSACWRLELELQDFDGRKLPKAIRLS